jgi:hypothetical protein
MMFSLNPPMSGATMREMNNYLASWRDSAETATIAPRNQGDSRTNL